MRVSELMIREVATCRLTDTLEDATRIMWDRDVGCLPVVDWAGRLVGILTDRDISLSAYARGERLAAISVTLAMANQVFSCGADDDVADVERTMATHRVRRVPALDASGRVIGILSLADIAATAARTGRIADGEVTETLAAVAGMAG